MSKNSEHTTIMSLLRRWLDKNTQSVDDELQRAADDDPFLAEAIEGYQQAGNGTHSDSDINRNLERLRKKLRQQTQPVTRPLYQTAMGKAALLAGVVLTIGLIWYANQSLLNNDMAMTQAEAPVAQEENKNSTSGSTFSLDEEIETSAQQKSEIPQAEPEPLEQASPSSRENKPKVYSTEPRKESVQNNSGEIANVPEQTADKVQANQIDEITTVEPDQTSDVAVADQYEASAQVSAKKLEPTEAELLVIEEDVAPSPEPAADVPVEEVAEEMQADDQAGNIAIAEGGKADRSKAKKSRKAKAKDKREVASSPIPQQQQDLSILQESRSLTITGKVLDDNGEPLIGVNVLEPGTNNGISTDVDGQFTLQVGPETDQLELSYIGFTTVLANIEDHEYVEIRMNSQNLALDAVRVTGYGTREPKSNEFLNPKGGFRKFKRYLKKNKRYPEAAEQNNIHGEVEVAFVINNDGRPEDFTILKSLGYGCDQEAIRLIREGPDWAASAGMKYRLTTVVVKF